MPAIAEPLSETNRRLQMLLDSLAAGQSTPVGSMLQLLSELLAVVSQGENCMRFQVPNGADLERDKDLAQYRKNLERLHATLPAVQARLLTERVRLEAERSHLEATKRWSDSAKATT